MALPQFVQNILTPNVQTVLSLAATRGRTGADALHVVLHPLAEAVEHLLQVGQADLHQLAGPATVGATGNDLHFGKGAVPGWQLRETDQIARVQETLALRHILHVEGLRGLKQVNLCIAGRQHIGQHQGPTVLMHGDT